MPVRNLTQNDDEYARRSQLLQQSFRENNSYLLHYVHGKVGQWQDAENIVQDLWRYALVYLDEEGITERGVLFYKARKLVMDYYRASERKPIMRAEELEEHHMSKQHQDAYTDAEETRLKDAFWGRFPEVNLTTAQKDVFWLYARYGFTYEEIKPIAGISVSTIGDWVTKARRKLAEQINQGSI